MILCLCAANELHAATIHNLELDHGNAVGNNTVDAGTTMTLFYGFTNVPADGDEYDIHELIFSAKENTASAGGLTATLSKSADGINFADQGSDSVTTFGGGFGDIVFTFGTIGATEFQVQENEVWRVILSTTGVGDYSVKWNGTSPVNWDLSEAVGSEGGKALPGGRTVSSTVGTSSPVPEPHEYVILTGFLLIGFGFIRHKKGLEAI